MLLQENEGFLDLLTTSPDLFSDVNLQCLVKAIGHPIPELLVKAFVAYDHAIRMHQTRRKNFYSVSFPKLSIFLAWISLGVHTQIYDEIVKLKIASYLGLTAHTLKIFHQI
jgi:hypothetical protein